MKKTIFIVGAGKGLGTSLGKKFGANDFRVVLMARNADSLDSYAKEFQAEGIEVYTKTTDAADDTGMSKAQTIYFIGLIVLLCGVGIVYANAKPVESK